MTKIKVTKEKCEKCLYGYPCDMLDELSLPSEGEICNNYEEIDEWIDEECRIYYE